MLENHSMLHATTLYSSEMKRPSRLARILQDIEPDQR